MATPPKGSETHRARARPCVRPFLNVPPGPSPLTGPGWGERGPFSLPFGGGKNKKSSFFPWKKSFGPSASPTLRFPEGARGLPHTKRTLRGLLGGGRTPSCRPPTLPTTLEGSLWLVFQSFVRTRAFLKFFYRGFPDRLRLRCLSGKSHIRPRRPAGPDAARAAP